MTMTLYNVFAGPNSDFDLHVIASSPSEAVALWKRHCDIGEGAPVRVLELPGIQTGAARVVALNEVDPADCPPSGEPPESYSLLACSTAHLSPEARKFLDESAELIARTSPNGAAMGTLGKTLYGWVVWVPENGFDCGVPSALEAVFQRARDLGFHYILFDEDADTLNDLPQYDW